MPDFYTTNEFISKAGLKTDFYHCGSYSRLVGDQSAILLQETTENRSGNDIECGLAYEFISNSALSIIPVISLLISSALPDASITFILSGSSSAI